MMPTQPGWYMHAPLLLQQTERMLRLKALPAPLRSNLEQQLAALKRTDVPIALFFASDMEQHGWYRPNVEAHETQHGFLHTSCSIDAVVSMIPVLSTYLTPYLSQFPPVEAVDEFLADLAGVEAGVAAGLSVPESVSKCSRNAAVLTRAWREGIRAASVTRVIAQTPTP